eukprot:SM006505S20280  [mRNA]  locus=s6505:3:833:- [translate_table: standard]
MDAGAGPPAGAMQIAVWWDAESCGLPGYVHPGHLVANMGAALQRAAVHGLLSIFAYADVHRLSPPAHAALAATGVNFYHVPSGRGSQVAMAVDMLLWALNNPPPAHVLLASGRSEYTKVMQRLWLLGYNVLVALPDGGGAGGPLADAASQVWLWDRFVVGEPGVNNLQRGLPSAAASA